MKDILYTPEADADIEAIWRYTMQEWGLEQAISYDADLVARIEGLASGGTVFRSAEEIRPGLRRALAGRHVVFFREDETSVTVIRVLHQSMDVGRWV